MPVVYAFYVVSDSFKQVKLVNYILILGSMVFYGFWNVNYLPLLLFSCGMNYGLGRLLCEDTNYKRLFLITGIGANLLILIYFKYYNFFLDVLDDLRWVSYENIEVILPLGISFFTFQQIAYLVDCYKKKTKEYEISNYILFVTFFPQLIAGPIVHHKEMMPQFQAARENIPKYFSLGISFFVIGLFKKVVLADGISEGLESITANIESGVNYNTLDAWFFIIGYTLQIYFDFSGYSDMAIGLAYLFGIKLPINFNSPYKAKSIIEFWRSWHITLSRFLMHYLYIPLGGNRKGWVKKNVNLMTTMLLGGLWHGANWNFIIWGGLHGVLLVINHSWRSFLMLVKLDHISNYSIYRLVAWTSTFMLVSLCWAFFRISDFEATLSLFKLMFFAPQYIPFDVYFIQQKQLFFLTVLGALIVFFLPNTNDYIFSFSKKLGRLEIKWGYNYPTLIFISILGFANSMALVYKNRIHEFVYFQF